MNYKVHCDKCGALVDANLTNMINDHHYPTATTKCTYKYKCVKGHIVIKTYNAHTDLLSASRIVKTTEKKAQEYE